MSVYQEHKFCNMLHDTLDCCRSFQDPNDIAFDFANEFNTQDRNIIRKLSKQYRIIAIEQQEDIYFDDGYRRIMVQEMPWIIKYQNWETNDPRFRPFEWKFNLNY